MSHIKTKVEIINETAVIYNLENRSVGPNPGLPGIVGNKTVCLYNGPDGKRCAFSRCCEEESVSQILEGGCLTDGVLIYLKEEYKGHSLDFWNDIQALHDNEDNWNKGGLNMTGIITRDQLINKWKD